MSFPIGAILGVKFFVVLFKYFTLGHQPHAALFCLIISVVRTSISWTFETPFQLIYSTLQLLPYKLYFLRVLDPVGFSISSLCKFLSISVLFYSSLSGFIQLPLIFFSLSTEIVTYYIQVGLQYIIQ